MKKLLASIWRKLAFICAAFSCFALSIMLVAINLVMIWNLYKEIADDNWRSIVNGEWEMIVRGLVSVGFLVAYFAIMSILLHRLGKNSGRKIWAAWRIPDFWPASGRAWWICFPVVRQT